MPDLFVDTSGWASLVDRKQQFHRQAVRLLDESLSAQATIFTSNWILIELTALLTRPLRIAKEQQSEFINELRSGREIQIIPIGDDLESQSWAIWSSRLDKDWTMTDCSSFALMARHRISRALTTDHHFEQAGFERLLQ